MNVKGVEVVVTAASIRRRVSVESRKRARKKCKLFTGIVSDHPDLDANLGFFGSQVQGLHVHEPNVAWVEAVEAEVVDRVAIDRVNVNFFVIEKDRF